MFLDNDDDYVLNGGLSQKPTKGDDAGVLVHFWDECIREKINVLLGR